MPVCPLCGSENVVQDEEDEWCWTCLDCEYYWCCWDEWDFEYDDVEEFDEEMEEDLGLIGEPDEEW